MGAGMLGGKTEVGGPQWSKLWALDSGCLSAVGLVISWLCEDSSFEQDSSFELHAVSVRI